VLTKPVVVYGRIGERVVVLSRTTVAESHEVMNRVLETRPEVESAWVAGIDPRSAA
jgi:hypothetical protein